MIDNKLMPIYKMNHSSLQWGIWGLIFFVFSSILIFSIAIFYWKLYRKKENLFTIKKVVFFATFLSISLFLTFIEGLIGKQLHISFDYVIPVVVGFIYGPLEGIIFSWITDTLNVVIHGWSYSVLSSLLLPTIGLVAGVAGIFYEKWKGTDKEILYSTIIIQISVFFCLIVLVSMILVSTLTPMILISKKDSNTIYYIFGAMSLVLFSTIEFLYFYFLKNKSRDNLLLLSMVLSSMIIARTLGSIVTPFQGYFVGYSANYFVSLLSFILHSSYVVPLEALLSYFFIKITLDFSILY